MKLNKQWIFPIVFIPIVLAFMIWFTILTFQDVNFEDELINELYFADNVSECITIYKSDFNKINFKITDNQLLDSCESIIKKKEYGLLPLPLEEKGDE